jgi:hypothetical protein
VAPNHDVDHRQPDPRTWGGGIKAVSSSFKLIPDGQLVFAGYAGTVVVDLEDEVRTVSECLYKNRPVPVTKGVDNEVIKGLAHPVPIKHRRKTGSYFGG